MAGGKTGIYDGIFEKILYFGVYFYWNGACFFLAHQKWNE
jgi:hypothetical protein